MSDDRKVAGELLNEAARTILKDRPGVHGSAENSFQMIGQLWAMYLRHVRKTRGHDEILPQDVSQMMVLLKIARATYGDLTNRDNFIDAIGYAALAGMLQLPASEEEPANEPPIPVDTFVEEVDKEEPRGSRPIGDILKSLYGKQA